MWLPSLFRITTGQLHNTDGVGYAQLDPNYNEDIPHIHLQMNSGLEQGSLYPLAIQSECYAV